MKTALLTLAATLKEAPGVDINIPKGLSTGPAGFSQLLGLVYTVAGIVAVIGLIIGGILYATSDGDPGRIKRAKDSIVYSIVGLLFVILAAAITTFVTGRF